MFERVGNDFDARILEALKKYEEAVEVVVQWVLEHWAQRLVMDFASEQKRECWHRRQKRR